MEAGAHASAAEVEYAGEVRAQTESRLGFQVAGKLVQRPVDVGDVVRKGQLLAELDAQDYALAAQAAQAQVAAAKTQRDLAQADWERYSALKEKGFISGVELDRRKANLQSAQAQLEQAQAQASAQSNQSSYTRLVANASGVITAVQAEPGQVVTAGAPVVQLAHDDARDVVIAVPEGVRSRVKPGQAVQVRIWAQDKTLDASVREVAASADPVTRTYTVKVQLQAGAQPPLGATAYVWMQFADHVNDTLIKLPSTVVWEQSGASMVWVFDRQSSSVHARKVEVAGVDGNDVVIAAGVEKGMQLVAAGTHVLTEGQKVSIYQPRHPDAAR
ncbi:MULTISPECIES: efflux RND transporter periplasmic adaptor subunit [Comamonas]|uniref:efflux RND transporter periplasmic adaptor subunit n=1 Tax=Comamonas TaxID=283 RepID=UPI00257CA73E|nr:MULTISPECIES: efflux RND transporter periplasmic adaptor subunit [Comamonas]